MKTLTSLLLFASTALSLCAHPLAEKLPIKGGENVLFIGNSLTGDLPEWFNEVATANQLPTINAWRVQLWNETLETHVKLSPEATPDKFDDGDHPAKAMQGYKIKTGHNSLWKQGNYNAPAFLEKGYITALEAIANGTPDGKAWDIVVIQAYTDAEDATNKISGDDKTFEGPLMENGKVLVEAIRAAGAQPVIYAAWGINPSLAKGIEGKFVPETYSRAIANYKSLGEHLKVPVIPIRVAAWSLFKERKPDGVPVEFLFRDNVHAASCGRALLMYNIVSAFTGKPATEMSYQNATTKQNDDTRYVVGEKGGVHDFIITAEIDRAIKDAAQTALAEYGFGSH